MCTSPTQAASSNGITRSGLSTSYLLGSEPDVFLVLPEDFGELCELGALAPLDGYLAQDEAVSDTDFYPAALQSGAENGVQYALPYECVPTLMCVNKTLLESEGIAVPSGDWTWENFYNICAKLRATRTVTAKPISLAATATPGRMR